MSHCFPTGHGSTRGVRGPAQEVGDRLELLVGVVVEDAVHDGVHRGVEAVQLTPAFGQRAELDAAAVGGAALADDPAAALEPVEDAGQGGRVQAGAPAEGARADPGVPADLVEALEV